MKQSIKLFVVAAFMLLSVESQATSWRVCSKPEARANFTSVRDAVASLDVFAGDTLYVEPGHMELGNELNINKQLILIGPGYYLNSNNINTMNPDEAKFNPSSVRLSTNETNIYGCTFLCTVNVSANNVILERCLFSNGINIAEGKNNISIRNNFFSNACILINYTLNSSIIENNIVLGRLCGSYNSYDGGEGYSSCVIRNNTIISWDNALLIDKATESEIYNNIILNMNSGFTTSINSDQTVDTTWNRDKVIRALDGTASSTGGNDVHHNILSCHPKGDYRNCVFNITTLEQVLLWNNATTLEEKYKHIANGIAVGAGTNGTTIGAYGAVSGSTPYRPAGIPQYRPYIYDANIDQTPSSNNTINASFKIKVQND